MAAILLVLLLISAATSGEALGLSRLPLLRAMGHAVGYGRDRDEAARALALATGAHGGDADSMLQASRGGGGSWGSAGRHGRSDGGRRRKRKPDVSLAARSVRVGNTDIPLTPTNLIIAANVLVFAFTKGGVRALFCPGPGPEAHPEFELDPHAHHTRTLPNTLTTATTTTTTSTITTTTTTTTTNRHKGCSEWARVAHD